MCRRSLRLAKALDVFCRELRHAELAVLNGVDQFVKEETMGKRFVGDDNILERYGSDGSCEIWSRASLIPRTIDWE